VTEIGVFNYARLIQVDEDNSIAFKSGSNSNRIYWIDSNDYSLISEALVPHTEVISAVMHNDYLYIIDRISRTSSKVLKIDVLGLSEKS
jgi:hypothetical protein